MTDYTFVYLAAKDGHRQQYLRATPNQDGTQTDEVLCSCGWELVETYRGFPPSDRFRDWVDHVLDAALSDG